MVIPTSITIAGLNFYTYGFILGLAVIVGIRGIERAAHLQRISSGMLTGPIASALLGALLGARVWHGVTDWQLYAQSPIELFAVWQGGLSIVGGVGGLGLGLLLWRIWKQKTTRDEIPSLLTLTDLTIFGLPIAQSIGRWANYVNQELYGYPSQLPWAIFIGQDKRVAGYEQHSYFHPLFLYESLAMAVFAGVVWWLVWAGKWKETRVGSGWLTAWYGLYYCTVRFVLEFLKLQVVRIDSVGLTLNQVVVLSAAIGSAWWIYLLRADDVRKRRV